MTRQLPHNPGYSDPQPSFCWSQGDALCFRLATEGHTIRRSASAFLRPPSGRARAQTSECIHAGIESMCAAAPANADGTA